MAWNPQGGGQSPWGKRPPGGGGPGGQPPDIEELLRKSQDKVRQMLPGGFGSGKGLMLVLIAGIALWLGSGFYRVQPGQQGIELLFGRYVKTTSAGLNYWFPGPIGEALTPNVDRTNQITIGFRGAGEGGTRDVAQESLMLTGDQNIIDVDFVVQWRIKNAADFLFNIRNPEATVKIASESAIREVMGQTDLEEALTTKRQLVESKTKDLLQEILDSYGAGVYVAEIKQQKVDPPKQVIDSFNDVQRAKQDKERAQNEAQRYENEVVPVAKGEAARVVQQAEAYREKVTKDAEGEAERFISVYNSYAVSKDVTRLRLYLESIQGVLAQSDKVIIATGEAGKGVVPYLPLPEIKKRSTEGAKK